MPKHIVTGYKDGAFQYEDRELEAGEYLLPFTLIIEVNLRWILLYVVDRGQDKLLFMNNSNLLTRGKAPEFANVPLRDREAWLIAQGLRV